MSLRSAFYIDGFNLYHAIDDLGEPHLKWCNLLQLARSLVPQASEEVVKVCFCTAYYPGDPQKKWRHQQYVNALEIVGVTCVVGHFVREQQNCRTCGAVWQKPTEKETDINIALHLMIDAYKNVFDKVYLLSSDSDQAATARLYKQQFASKQFVTVALPGRPFSVHIEKYAGGRIALNRDHVARNLLPAILLGKGRPNARRPREYDPPGPAPA